MKLYHFCAAHLLEDIKKSGLTLGMIPFIENNKLKHVKCYQWLTINSSFIQSWEKDFNLPYRRNSYRITIKIPKKERCKLIPWLPFSTHEKLKETAEIMNSAGDPENWFIFRGRIKPGWFREIKRRHHDKRTNKIINNANSGKI